MSKTLTTGQAGKPAKNQTTPINETSVAKKESKKNDQPKKPRSQSGKSQTKPKKEDDKNVPVPKQTADKPDSKPNTAPKASIVERIRQAILKDIRKRRIRKHQLRKVRSQRTQRTTKRKFRMFRL